MRKRAPPLLLVLSVSFLPSCLPSLITFFVPRRVLAKRGREGLSLLRFPSLPVMTRTIYLLLQAFIATGFNIVLSFDTFSHSFHPDRRQIDFEKDPGKVSKRRQMVADCSYPDIHVRFVDRSLAAAQCLLFRRPVSARLARSVAGYTYMLSELPPSAAGRPDESQLTTCSGIAAVHPVYNLCPVLESLVRSE